MDYVEIYYNNTKIGYIAQDSEGLIYVNAKDDGYISILKSFLIPFRIDKASVEGDVSISEDSVILSSDPDWINYLEYNLPKDYTTSELKNTTKKKFVNKGFG